MLWRGMLVSNCRLVAAAMLACLSFSSDAAFGPVGEADPVAYAQRWPERDCQDFRVWAGIMGKKESHYVPTQRTCDPV